MWRRFARKRASVRGAPCGRPAGDPWESDAHYSWDRTSRSGFPDGPDQPEFLRSRWTDSNGFLNHVRREIERQSASGIVNRRSPRCDPSSHGTPSRQRSRVAPKMTKSNQQ